MIPLWSFPVIGWVVLTTCVMLIKAIEQRSIEPLDVATWLLLTLPTIIISFLSVYIFKNS